MNCDNCKHYRWYYDRCEKWGCEVDAREVHNCFEKREILKRTTAILSALLILASCLTFPISAKASESQTNIPEGAYGVWEIASLGTISPLYTSKANTSRENQRVVDRENCALWWRYSKGHAIVDHLDSEVGDGLWRVNEMHVSDIATLTTSKGKTYYECRAIWMATQTKYVYQYDGSTIQVKAGDIICVSCADEDGYNYVAYFKKIA